MIKSAYEHSDVEQNDRAKKQQYVLRLFVTGATANSIKAISNIKSICENYLHGRYKLEIVDLYKKQNLAEQEQIVALPMLLKYIPFPQRRLIGDLSDTKKVLELLGLKQ